MNAKQCEIIKKINNSYDNLNLCLPNGLCNGCRSKLSRNPSSLEKPDYSSIFKNGTLKWTRENEKVEVCDCKICEMAASKGGSFKKLDNTIKESLNQALDEHLNMLLTKGEQG